jgi:hypothetical protein
MAGAAHLSPDFEWRRTIVKIAYVVCSSVAIAVSASAQTPSGTSATAGVPSAEHQIAAAVLPLPVDLRANATVMGYAPDGRFVTLRSGSGPMNCLASNPTMDRFHVACYHKSLEPFMARGRQLRAQGVTGDQVDTVRFREARAGTLKLPKEPAVLYSLTGGSFDPAAGAATGARALFVVYVPFATAESTGLSAKPLRGTPWIMSPGTPKAHIMFTPSM